MSWLAARQVSTTSYTSILQAVLSSQWDAWGAKTWSMQLCMSAASARSCAALCTDAMWLMKGIFASCSNVTQVTGLLPCPAGAATLPAGGRIEGDIRVNGYPKEQDSFARVSGYVSPCL